MKEIYLAAAVLLAPVLCNAAGADTLGSQQLQPVTVSTLRTTMLKRNVPYVVEVITPGDIARSSARSLPEMVSAFTPAEAVDLQGLTGGVELRGFAPDGMGRTHYTLMLVDGVRMGTYNGAATTLTGVSAIEVFKGPFSSLYGSGAMGGVINVITPQSKGKIHGGVQRSWGSFNTSALNAAAGGSITGRLDFDFGLSYFNRGDDYSTGGRNILKMNEAEKEGLVLPYSRDTTYNNTAYDQTHGMVRLGWDICSSWRLNFYNDIYYTGRALANGTLWGFYGMTMKNSTRDFYRLDLTGNEGKHSLRVTPYIGFENNEVNDLGFGNTLINRMNTIGFTAQDAIDFGFGTLLAGFDNLTERYATKNRSLASSSPDSPYQPDYNNVQTGVFAQFSFLLFDDRLSGIAGVRYDKLQFKTLNTPYMPESISAKHDYDALNPNLSLQYRFLRDFRVHAAIGRAFIAPEAYKMTGEYSTAYVSYRGNPDLKPEVSLTKEAGIGYASPDGSVEADAGIFFTDHDNLIVSSAPDADGVLSYENAEEATIRGIELIASFDLGRALGRDWSWRFHGSWMRIFHSEVKTAAETREREYLSRTKANFGTVFTSNRLTASIQGRYAGLKTEQNLLKWNMPAHMRPTTGQDEQITNPASLIFDASVSYRVYKGFSIGVTAANILDELYMSRDGYYMPGRNLTVNAGFRF